VDSLGGEKMSRMRVSSSAVAAWGAFRKMHAGDHHVLAEDSLASDEGHGGVGGEVRPDEGLDGGHGISVLHRMLR